jgi:heme/copper-type cytochrome/quinol oxidase subunit 1
MSFQATCYAAAALFAVFACLYGVFHVPFGKGMAQLHFWLSAAGVTLLVIGMVLLGSMGNDFTYGPHVQPPQEELALSAFGLTLGPPLFLAGQVPFVVNLTKAIFKLARVSTHSLARRV